MSVGQYDHINSDFTVEVEMGIDEFVKLICDGNYGTHRLLSAIVRYRDGRDVAWHRPDELADRIRDLLERGLF